MIMVVVTITVIVVIAIRLSGNGIQEQLFISVVEVKHVEQRAGPFIGRSAADSPCAPVVFNEAQDGRLVGQRPINKVRLGERRDNQQRQARTKTALALYSARSAGAAIAGAIQAVSGGVGRRDDR